MDSAPDTTTPPRTLQALQDELDKRVAERYPGVRTDRELIAQAIADQDFDYLRLRIQLGDARHRADSFELAWLAPGQVPEPREALMRIRAVCRHTSSAFDATITVLATHPGIARDMLAQALKQLRPEFEPYSRDDVLAMMKAAWVGGREGFEAVMRTRRNGPRKVGVPAWVQND